MKCLGLKLRPGGAHHFLLPLLPLPSPPLHVSFARKKKKNKDSEWDGRFDDKDDFVPHPSNLPTNEPSSDSLPPSLNEAFQRSIEERRRRHERLITGPREDLLREIPFCHVITFRQKLSNGTTEEGIYSMSVIVNAEGTEFEQIIPIFEDRGDAESAAAQLSDYTQHKPIVQPVATKTILDFAEESDYHVQLEPRGSTFMAPDTSFGSLDGSMKTEWERSIDIREKGIKVVKEDPEPPKVDDEQERIRQQLKKMWDSS